MNGPATTPDAERVAQPEQLAELRALAAAAGWRVEALADGSIELWRWSRFRRFASAALAAAFVESVGSRR